MLPNKGKKPAKNPRSPIRTNGIYRLRYAGMSFQLCDGFTMDAIRLLGLRRLGRIFQLQFLTPYRVFERVQQFYPIAPHGFGHDRLIHSVVSAAMHVGALMNERVDKTDILVSILAELVHDALTCAGGDAMKIIDPQFFDEDRMIEERLFRRQHKGWDELRQKYNLPYDSPARVQAIVDGRGWQGQIHEIADVCSYVVLDCAELEFAYRNNRGVIPEDLQKILAIASDGVCNIWRFARLEGNSAVVTDPNLLKKFLELRIRLWRSIYENTAHKAIELMMTEIVFPYLFRQKKINRNMLLRIDDQRLRRLIEKELETPGLTTMINPLGVWPELTSLSKWNEALVWEDVCVWRGDCTLMVDMRLRPTIKSKVGKYLVPTRDGSQPFNIAFPALAAEVEAVADSAQSQNTVFVFHYPGMAALLSKPLKKAWQEARTRWLAR